MRIIIISVIVFLFSSCEKQELPVKAYDRGSLLMKSIPMESNYSNQVYFKLSTNEIIKINNKFSWDLGFSCDLKSTLFLNSSKAMYVRELKNTFFQNVIDTIGFEKYKTWDASSGNLDSTAFGTNLDTSSVFVLFLGYSETGMSLGFKKIKFVDVGATSYEFVYANLDGTDERRFIVEKDPRLNQVQFSFKLNDLVLQEPNKLSYDLLFTQYIHTFYNPYQSYLVTGVLVNHPSVKVGLIKNKTFEDIGINDTSNVKFENRADKIGYDWKYFSFNDNKFTVDPSMVYLIIDQLGFYYKLHFIDFYNEFGQKGYPKFEFQKL